MKELKDTAESHASLVLYPAIRAAMNELGQLHEGFSDNVNRAWNTLHAAFWSESPAPASEPGLRGVASQEAETVVEPSSNRGVLPDPGEMGFPATYTFEQFVQYGRQHAEELVNGVPWHFAFHGRMVTHERDDCYLVGGTSMAKHFRFTPGRKITVNLDGSMTLHYEEKNATFLDVAEAAQEKQHFAHIEPTIGRRVWYRPDARMGATNFHILGDQPMDAGIVFVWGQRLVNLDVTDHAGVHHAFTSVTLLQPGDKEPENGGFCQWMPFQIGQARK